jgi:hypothetical protein
LIVPHHPDYAVLRRGVARAVSASEVGNDATAQDSPHKPAKDSAQRAAKGPGSDATTDATPSGQESGSSTVDVRQVCRTA